MIARSLTSGQTRASSVAIADRFIVWLLAGSVLPVPVFALLEARTMGGPAGGVPSIQSIIHVVVLLNVMHVGLSALFWIDRRYRGHMASQPGYYYRSFLFLLALSAAGSALVGNAFHALYPTAILVWNLFHFARQNWGVLCFTALGTGTDRPGRMENWGVYAGFAGGAIAVLPQHVRAFLPEGTQALGLALVLAGLGLALAEAWRLGHAGAPWARIATGVMVGTYFLPVYLLPNQGLVCIAAVHTVQYAVIMTVLAADRNQGSRLWRVGGMLALAALYLAATQLLDNAAIWGIWSQPVLMLLLSVVAWHFIVDGGVFRLSQPFQRQAARESFGFLYAAGAARRAGQE